MEFDSVDKALVERLFADGRVDLYRLHEERRFSPAVLVRSVSKLAELGIIESIDRDKHIAHARSGSLGSLFKLRNLIFRRQKSWERIPEDFIDEKISVNGAYRPVYQLLGKFMLDKQRKKKKDLNRRRVD